jgi:hypothetical protein
MALKILNIVKQIMRKSQSNKKMKLFAVLNLKRLKSLLNPKIIKFVSSVFKITLTGNHSA